MSETETATQLTNTDTVKSDNDSLASFLTSLQALSPSDRTSKSIARLITEATGWTHALILSYDSENATLNYDSAYPAPAVPPNVYINTFNVETDSVTAKLVAGEIVSYKTLPDDDRLGSLTGYIKQEAATLVPLMSNGNLLALLALYKQPNTPLDDEAMSKVQELRPAITLFLEIAFQHVNLDKRIKEIETEAEIFRRIDEELSDVIDLNYVFTMLKDWALRFSNADAAALALYNNVPDTLTVMSQYGFKPNAIEIGEELPQDQSRIPLRVARRGLPEIVPNVALDSDYYALAEGMQAQMSIPIKREERVIGVLTLLSRQVNGFQDEQLEFTKKLANRAGVAVDNARLFTETKREREKLSSIVRNIADNVILVGLDHRIEMINSAAILAFHLSVDENYIGKKLTDVINHSQLQIAYHDAVEQDDNVTTEVELPNEKTYHVSIEYHAGTGRIIVMQDITYFKETDRLKTELVATVSHDLKQPLSVMRGYLDLLKMVNQFDEKSMRYIDNLNLAFHNMRQLIDDLLDIARIEAGLKLEIEDVFLIDVLNRAVKNTSHLADVKNIKMDIELPASMPMVGGDPKRLEQVFNNLISNAIKYTKPEGEIKVYVEVRPDTIRVFVKDNGMGIGAEDQAKIFERFYRVRRPETDSIEGTGLGLAIVKSLVEAHTGKIDLKSILGEGSTFRVTLPTQN